MTRRTLTLTSRHNRFIAEYIRVKHPAIYTEADELHSFLKQLYPDKRDLRKVPEYLQLTTGVKNINAYYYKNRVSKKVKDNNKYEIVLEIPLLTANENPSATINPEKTSVPAVDLPTMIPEETSVPALDLPTIIPEETSVPAVDLPTMIPEETNVPTDEPTSIIPDKVYQDLLSEISKDPDLYAIFNNFDVSGKEHESIEELTSLQCESFEELTPLELELQNLGW